MRRQAAVLLLCFASFVPFLSCGRQQAPKADPLLNAYDVQRDWNIPERLIALDYPEAQGKRVFYEKCVWCHADSTPAGPSNRSNLSPIPALINDGNVMNALSDTYIQNIISMGGGAVGKSALMPPWGKTLSQDHIQELVAFIRAVAHPPYQRPTGSLPQYLVR